MKKVVIPKAGGYERLTIEEFESPTVSRNQVCIDVHYSGVNYADVLIRLGVYESAKKYVGWPITPGFEVSGVVSQIGEDVTQFLVGDEVFGFTLFNGYSQQICLPESQILKIPKGYTLAQSATIPAAYMTAYYALYLIFHLPSEALLLVHSAAGGVGSALVSLAHAKGHKVVGIVGDPSKKEHVYKLGAIKVYSKSEPGFSWDFILSDYSQGFDAVFDANGYPTFRFSYQALKPTGKLVAYGSHSLLSKTGGRINYLKAAWGLLSTPRFNPLDLITDNKSVIGFNLSFLFDYELLKTNCLNGLMECIESASIPPPTVCEFSLNEVAKAHQWIESGKSIGKIAIRMQDEI